MFFFYLCEQVSYISCHSKYKCPIKKRGEDHTTLILYSHREATANWEMIDQHMMNVLYGDHLKLRYFKLSYLRFGGDDEVVSKFVIIIIK